MSDENHFLDELLKTDAVSLEVGGQFWRAFRFHVDENAQRFVVLSRATDGEWACIHGPYFPREPFVMAPSVAQSWHDMAALALEIERFGAVFSLPGALFVAARDGYSHLLPLSPRTPPIPTTFRLPRGVKARRARELLRLEWERPNSDLRFAWNFARCSSREMRPHVLKFDGDIEEFTRVAYLFAMLDVARRPGRVWTWISFLHGPRLHSRLSRWTGTGWSEEGRDATSKVSRAFDEWAQKVWAPAWNSTELKAHPCLKCLAGVPLAAFSLEVPSHHEQMEAALELREWARGKVPDEVLKTLS